MISPSLSGAAKDLIRDLRAQGYESEADDLRKMVDGHINDNLNAWLAIGVAVQEMKIPQHLDTLEELAYEFGFLAESKKRKLRESDSGLSCTNCGSSSIIPTGEGSGREAWYKCRSCGSRIRYGWMARQFKKNVFGEGRKRNGFSRLLERVLSKGKIRESIRFDNDLKIDVFSYLQDIRDGMKEDEDAKPARVWLCVGDNGYSDVFVFGEPGITSNAGKSQANSTANSELFEITFDMSDSDLRFVAAEMIDSAMADAADQGLLESYGDGKCYCVEPGCKYCDTCDCHKAVMSEDTMMMNVGAVGTVPLANRVIDGDEDDDLIGYTV